MGFFDLVEQQYAVGCLADGVCQQPAVFIADIAGRRADEFGYGMLLCVFAHVETDQFDAQFLGQYTGYLRLSDTCRTYEE